jgi:DNA-binding winged helix-turn-helix (wHTH) protein
VSSGDVYAFGPYQLDTKTRRLTRGSEPVALTARQFDLLHLFVSRAGHVLSKDALIAAAWPDVAVTDNSLEQAISGLRRMLTPPSGHQYIETQARRGYCFSADVKRVMRRESDEALDALLAPHREWIEGRAALETLAADQIVRARAVFEELLAQVPDQASAHVGLANACALQFETTRADSSPDVVTLERAIAHAREACRLDSQYGEAWATLGFVLDRTGRHDDAVAASRRAVALEPDNWRHHLRLAYASWGEERLRAARRTLALLPGLALAHWLAATVYVARQALPEAERELRAGIAEEKSPSRRFSGVALHWLLGLIHLSRDAYDAARHEFADELKHEHIGHMYARECAANTWYAVGALELRCGDRASATAAFAEALARVPNHVLARVGLATAAGRGETLPANLDDRNTVSSVHVAMARAVALVLRRTEQDRARAADTMAGALAEAPSGNAGWLLPIEPTLHVSAHPAAWSDALATLRNRAT